MTERIIERPYLESDSPLVMPSHADQPYIYDYGGAVRHPYRPREVFVSPPSLMRYPGPEFDSRSHVVEHNYATGYPASERMQHRVIVKRSNSSHYVPTPPPLVSPEHIHHHGAHVLVHH